MPVDSTLADPTAEPNTWKATVLDPWVADVSGTIATLEAGSGGSSFGTISAAITAASAGDTVWIPPGVYRENVAATKAINLLGGPGVYIKGSDDWSSANETWTSIAAGYRSTTAAPNFGIVYDAVRHTDGTLSPIAIAVYLDGVPQTLIGVAGETAGEGEFSINASRQIILGTNPAGHLVEVTIRQQWINPSSNDVSLFGITFEHSANDARGVMGITNKPGATAYNRLHITNCTFRDTYGPAVFFVEGAGNWIINSTFERCGNVAIGISDQDDLIIRGNEISESNYRGLWQSSWEAGGIKGGMNLLKLTPVTIEITENNVHDNTGIGIWLDVFFDGGASKTIVVSNNRVYRNSYAGIQFEISRRITCEDNICYLNGQTAGINGPMSAGIVIYNCEDIIPTRCISAWNADGITYFVASRTEHAADLVPAGFTYANTRSVNCIILMGRPRAAEATHTAEYHYSEIAGYDVITPADASYHGAGTGNRLYWSYPEGATFPADSPDANRFAWSDQVTSFPGITTLAEYIAVGGYNATNRLISDIEMIRICSTFDIPMDIDDDMGVAMPAALTPTVALDSSTATTVASTASVTTLGSTLSLAARALSRGTHIRLEAWGVYGATGTPNLTMRIVNTSTAIATTGAVALVAVTNRGWHLSATLRVNDPHDFASGTWEVQGMLQLAGQTTNFLIDLENTAALSLNSSSASDLHLDVQWGTSNAANTITVRQMTIEVLPYVPGLP